MSTHSRWFLLGTSPGFGAPLEGQKPSSLATVSPGGGHRGAANPTGDQPGVVPAAGTGSSGGARRRWGVERPGVDQPFGDVARQVGQPGVVVAGVAAQALEGLL